jgi:UDP-N-acetylmuramate--alanine ligase
VNVPSELTSLEPGSSVHFVGIGGVRLSALAEMLSGKGFRVSGSDREASVFTDRLKDVGVRVVVGHDATNIGDAETLVFTPAVDPENPELVAGRENGLRIIEGKALLGALTRGKRLIAVSGTHGKTTTTAMITQICETAGLDPTAFVGGAVQGVESNLRVGADDVWVVEADEYDRAFLELVPTVAVVTSLEADHLDLYVSEDEIVSTFDAFLENIGEGGTAVVCEDYPAVQGLTIPTRSNRIGFSATSEADLSARTVRPEGLSTTFKVTQADQELGDITIQLPGLHNVSNALAAIGAAAAIDIAWTDIRDGLAAFRGVRRRFEVMGEVDGVTVVNDYAHHPTEIEQTLMAARSVWDGRVVAVFQPHLFSRTRDFADGFRKALSQADVCWLTDIYPARETPIPGITGRMIAEGIPECLYEGDLSKLASAVMAAAKAGDLVLVMGAGSIEMVGRELSKKGRAGEQESGRAGEEANRRSAFAEGFGGTGA